MRTERRQDCLDKMAGKSSRRILLLLLVVFSLYIQFFHGLGQLGLVGPDEPRYAQVAREMMGSGDFITPHLYGKPWFEKPILYYWLTVQSYRVLGVSEIAARLPAALSAILLILAVFTIGWKWRSSQCGMVAALMLASSPICISLGRAASMDMPLTAALTLSLAGFYLGLSIPRGNGSLTHGPRKESPRIWLSVAYSSLGVALLAKGPVGLVLVGLILLSFFALRPEIYSWKKLWLIPGGFLFLSVALPWYILCFKVNGWAFIKEFLFQHNLARFATDRFQHSQPSWFFLMVIFVGFLPWSLHFGAACIRDLRRLRHPETRASNSDTLFFWVWVIVPLVFFSLSRSKLPGYILPIFPAMALLTASYWEDRLKEFSQQPAQNKRPWLEILQSIVIIAAGLGLLIWRQGLNIEAEPSLSLLSWLIIGMGGIGLVLIFLGFHWTLFVSYLAGCSLGVLLIVHQIFPQIDAIESARQLAVQLERQEYHGEPVFAYGVSRRIVYGLSFYLNSEARLIYSLDEADTRDARSFYLLTVSSTDEREFGHRFKVEKEVPFHKLRLWKLHSCEAGNP
jgi:4-amino-4-deoxy-L-arabinose transferase-like glycosyltransferase